ncbi:IS110 family transposase [Mycobacterium spongiae]|uniref:IS110 family transposase n=1 Tax=Mycobacterium spongiae TaxID=886343 RepID=UPI001FEA0B63|nr:IS110 family transposase [Mycobacterium spongiae]
MPADTELAQTIRVLARAQRDAVWARQKLGNQIRSLLKDFYQAALEAFAGLYKGELSRPEARSLLVAAPTPTKAATLTRTKLRALLVKAGHKRGMDYEADRLPAVFGEQFLRQPALVEDAMEIHLAGLLIQLNAACRAT